MLVTMLSTELIRYLMEKFYNVKVILLVSEVFLEDDIYSALQVK